MLFWRRKTTEQLLATAKSNSLRRSLGAGQLTILGVGAIIGTGIFVLVSVAAQKAGPGMMVSFVVAGFVCAVVALCYSEMAGMVPVAGSAYAYTYTVFGELVAWAVGWALLLEYTLAASTVSVGWSGYAVGLANDFGIGPFPKMLISDPAAGGILNLPAAVLALVVTALLVIGTRASARFTTVLVVVKLTALAIFVVLVGQHVKTAHFLPFAPLGWNGISAAAATIFFAYLGFDALATAAEETKNPQRNVPIGIGGSLAICTVVYLLVAAGIVGTVAAQPLAGPDGVAFEVGGSGLATACGSFKVPPLVCSREPLAFALQQSGNLWAANVLRAAAGFSLPSVVLLMMFAQTRILFAMSRDGLLPATLSRLHSRRGTPYIVTIVTGLVVMLFASVVPVGRLADLSNAGTLFAFCMVAIAVMIERVRAPERKRAFRTPLVCIVAPCAVFGCLYLFGNLGTWTKALFLCWSLVGAIVYRLYGYGNSLLSERAISVTDGALPVRSTVDDQ
jgi:APA family basic amino acid/polyamine antiporter